MNATAQENKSWWVVLWPAGNITVEAKPGPPGGSSKIPTTTPDQWGVILSYHSNPFEAEEVAAKERSLRASV